MTVRATSSRTRWVLKTVGPRLAPLVFMIAQAMGMPRGPVQNQVTNAAVEVQLQHQNNVVLSNDPYWLELRTFGADITDVIVIPPVGSPIQLAPIGPNNWFVEEIPFPSAPLGQYVFAYSSSIGGDVLTVDFNPVQTTGFAFVTYPIPNSTSVPLSPTFTWNSVVGLGASIGIEMYDATADEDGEYAALAISETTWTPTRPLEAGHMYQFEITVANLVTTPASTQAGDAVDYETVYSHVNSIFFRTAVVQSAHPILATYPNLCIPGIGGVLPCPCSNPQVPAHSARGCDNSSGTGGALLTAAGTASLTSDTLQFVASGEKPTASSILLQGQMPASSTGLKFGQGVRCITAGLKRLYVHNAAAGSVTFPTGADAAVSVQSAAKGDTITVGGVRLYAVYYRDPTVLGACAPSDTFNLTQTKSVVWNP